MLSIVISGEKKLNFLKKVMSLRVDCYKMLAAAFFVAVLLLYPGAVAAIGVSPGSTTIENAANGLRIPKTIRVTRPSTTGILNFTVEANGPGGRYIELSSRTLTIPDGANYVDYPFVIAPVNAPNGTHEAFIQFLSSQGGGNGGSQFMVATYEGITARVTFKVTGQEVLQYTIGGFGTEPIETNTAPTFTFMLKNDGNVDAQPEKIDFNITDAKGDLKLSETVLAASLPVVEPGQEKAISTSLTRKLPPGVYFVDATFTSQGKTLYERKKIRLEILPEGTLQQDGQMSDLSVNEKVLPVGGQVKVTGIFSNIGEIGVRATLYVQIKKDGVTLDTLRSEEQYVGYKRTGIFNVTFRPDVAGTYTFEGSFAYGIKETNKRSVVVEATSPVKSFQLQLPIARLKNWLFACTPRFTPLILIIVLVVETILLMKYIRLWKKHERCVCELPCACHGGEHTYHQQMTPIDSAVYASQTHIETRPVQPKFPAENKLLDQTSVSDSDQIPKRFRDDDPFEEIAR